MSYPQILGITHRKTDELKIMNSAKMTKTRKQNCPSCGIILNVASDLSGEYSPEPGDITICAKCQTILAFGEAMDFRPATADEIKLVENEINLVRERFTQSNYTLLNTPNGPGILCHECGHSSSNLHDIENRYCGHCHKFLND
jgi:predicted RNA-binding Zn-ribbon protein involved in translation (DUF1610 family)